jgi:hypothetical protein
MNRNARSAATLACLLSSLCWQSAHASDHVVCGVISTSSAVTGSGDGLALAIALENKGEAAVTFDNFILDPNLIKLRARTIQDNQELTPRIPLVSPGLGPLRIAGGGKFTKTIALSNIFPGLEAKRRESAIEISWVLELKPLSGCFSKSESSTVLLPKTTVAGSVSDAK